MNIHTDPEVEKFVLSLEKQTIAKVLRTIYLLNGFVKKSQKTPYKELKKVESKYRALT